jgi:hypothetical protein
VEGQVLPRVPGGPEGKEISLIRADHLVPVHGAAPLAEPPERGPDTIRQLRCPRGMIAMRMGHQNHH